MKPSTPYQSDDKKRSSGTSHSTGLNLQKNPGNWTSLGLNPYRGAPSVHFESPDGGHKHHHVGTKSRIAALDVKKLLHADISSESCLSHWKERHSCQNVIPMCPNNKKRNGILLPILQKYSPTNPSGPTSLSAILSAMMEELPWAMLANGPAWTNTGVPCEVNTL